MKYHYCPAKAKGWNGWSFGIFRFVVFSLLTAAFTFTSVQAQNVSLYPNPDNTEVVIPATNQVPAPLQPQRAVSASSQIFAYVADAVDSSIAVIDTATNQLIATIPLPTPPFPVVGSPDGTRVYAVGLSPSPGMPGNLYVIDTTNNSLLRTIQVPPVTAFTSLAITPDGKTLYWSIGSSRYLVALDIASGNVVAGLPQIGGGAVVMAPGGADVYVANFYGYRVSTVSAADNTILASLYTGYRSYPGNAQMGITPDGRFLYVPLYFAGVAVMDTAANAFVGSPIPMPSGATAVSVTPNGAFAYAAGLAAPSISVIETSTNTVVGTIPTTHPRPGTLAFTPDGAFLYVTDEGGAVDVISTASNSVVATVPLAQPLGIAIVKVPPPPTAVAGPNQTITVGQVVQLDGSGSYAPDTSSAQLQYAWSFVSQPAGSAATLTGANTATPSFTADVPGDFVVQLVVTDPATTRASEPSQVTISSIWSPPTANAGPPQSVAVRSSVELNGLGSADANGLPLTYDWSFQAKPDGSNAIITGSGGIASFFADVVGTYIVQLVVSDAFGSSQPATVTITAITPGDYAQLRISEAIQYIAAMPTAHFDAPGHRNALINQLQETIDDIQKEKKSQAFDKLVNAAIRTDGFPLRGAADGNGAGMDWIIDAADQNFVFQKLADAAQQLMKPAT